MPMKQALERQPPMNSDLRGKKWCVRQLLKSWLWGFAALASVLCAQVYAQDYPDQPIRLIVPFAPGGGSDVLARIVGKYLGIRAWGSPSSSRITRAQAAR